MTMPITPSPAPNAGSHELRETNPQGRYLCFGRLQVDVKREELFRDGARIRVPSKVYQVLMALLEKPGEVVTREELRARLWPEGTFVNFDANVNTAVNKLRLVLGGSPDQPIYVETIPRQGYCFLGHVERRTELAKAAGAVPVLPSGKENQDEHAASASVRELFRAHMAGFLASGWAAAVLLCGVLIGIGIVLYTHRPS